MKKLLGVIALFVVLASVSYADMNSSTINSAGWEELTASQQAAVIKDIADKAAVTKNNNSSLVGGVMPDPQKIDEWVQIGAHIGQGLAGAAKELGVAANDFVKTPVGMLTMALIIWHFIGSALVHVFGSIIVLLCGALFIRWYSNQCIKITKEYDTAKTNLFGNSVLIKNTKSELEDGDKGWCLGLGVATFITFLAVLLTI